MSTDNIKKTKSEEYEYDTLTNERLIKDHDYDGIRELDNPMPPWWKWLFYLTIIFAVIYMIRIFVFKSDDLIQDREYVNEMKDVAKDAPSEAEAAEFEKKPGTKFVQFATWLMGVV